MMMIVIQHVNIIIILMSIKKYHCTETEACPEGYKLIESKKKCIDDCGKDDTYKYPYYDKCIETLKKERQ